MSESPPHAPGGFTPRLFPVMPLWLQVLWIALWPLVLLGNVLVWLAALCIACPLVVGARVSTIPIRPPAWAERLYEGGPQL